VWSGQVQRVQALGRPVRSSQMSCSCEKLKGRKNCEHCLPCLAHPQADFFEPAQKCLNNNKALINKVPVCSSGQGKAQADSRGFTGLPLSHPPIAADISYISHTQGGEYIVFRGCILVLLNAFSSWGSLRARQSLGQQARSCRPSSLPSSHGCNCKNYQ